MEVDFIFSILILVMSVVVHEVSHGYVAEALGDPTARYAGRLTLNPLKHLDLMGSIIIPLILIVTKVGFVVGWAKPVPVNPYNLKNQKWGEAIVAGAGPASNILLALVFGLLIRFGVGVLPDSFLQISAVVVLTNIVLAIFNLVPVPPLDGSKIFFSLLPAQFFKLREMMERYGLILVLLVITIIWEIIFPIVPFLFRLITGIGL